ncbi:hypothetical protein [[Clostridium] fimetarium]|uniref:Uncharacterized protein n=1 Tax=[Clostridium] fimetarium TaxID=99656 RepID=A0A1I0QVT9_9FIRM|nr:hypothetical protein [[Clostridium] fimetarium]SEW31550.1 hypothetical protein SAMN05421659_109159 [[Clostridium] fimetarium]
MKLINQMTNEELYKVVTQRKLDIQIFRIEVKQTGFNEEKELVFRLLDEVLKGDVGRYKDDLVYINAQLVELFKNNFKSIYVDGDDYFFNEGKNKKLISAVLLFEEFIVTFDRMSRERELFYKDAIRATFDDGQELVLPREIDAWIEGITNKIAQFKKIII